MEILFFSANSVLPIIIVIILGYILRQKNFYSDSFLKTANKLVFRILLPCYLFFNIYEIESLESMNASVLIACFIAIFVIFILAFIVICLYTRDNGKRGALIQCAFRSNFAIIGVTLAEAMGGIQAVASAAVLSAVSIPLFNILAVITLSVFSSEKTSVDIKGIFMGICKNPLIIGVCSGIFVVMIRENYLYNAQAGTYIFTIKENLPFLYKSVKSVSSMASPLALVVLGGQFSFSAVKELSRDITVGVLWRLVITPVLAIGSILLLAKYTDMVYVTKADLPAMVALFGSPVAVSSAIMAEEMKSHGELARQLVVWTSLCSIATMFIAVAILKAAALI